MSAHPIRSRVATGTFVPLLSSKLHNPFLRGRRIPSFTQHVLGTAEMIWFQRALNMKRVEDPAFLARFEVVDEQEGCGIFGKAQRLLNADLEELRLTFHPEDFSVIQGLARLEHWSRTAQRYGYLGMRPTHIYLIAPEPLVLEWRSRFDDTVMRQLDHLEQERGSIGGHGSVRMTSSF